MDANRAFGRSIYVDPKAPHQELTDKQREIMDAVPYVEPNPIAQRLQGRIDQLLRHGRVKDPELMQSAVESLTELIDAAQCLLDYMVEPDDSAEAFHMSRLRSAIASAKGK